MGMIDTLRLFGPDASRARCAAGHPAQQTLTTKSFECNQDDYYVFEGQLYVVGGNTEADELLPSIEGGKLALLRRQLAEVVTHHGDVVAYTHCEQCDPIVFEREDLDRTDHRRVWCEWSLTFERGRLARVEGGRLETREALREQMLRDGVGVLPDEDRIAKKYMKQLREGRTRFPW